MKQCVFVLLATLLLCVSPATAQERQDVIYLKSGDVLRGVIIENVPNQLVRIELPGGSVFTVKYQDIDRFAKERVETGYVSGQQAPQQMDMQTMMLYEQQKKSSGTAVLLSLLITSSGHAYAGNWPRGLAFTAARIGCAVLALTVGIEEKRHSSGWYYDYYTTEVNEAYYIGLVGLLTFAIWEAIDSAGEANRYNQKLSARMTGDRRFGMHILPHQDGSKFLLSYSF